MTTIDIRDAKFYIDGAPTYAGRTFRGYEIEGLLLNTRMVQATFDDLNPVTRARWAYPDTGFWDAARNVEEFLAALPTYRDHGVLAVTVNFQGGSPEGYSKDQPWEVSAFEPDGAPRPAYFDRMARILNRLDELGMIAIVGLFYFGQDERLTDEVAVVRAMDETVTWLLEGGWTNVLLEVNNECDVPHYEHSILQPQRVHELIARVAQTTVNDRRLLVGTSYGGGSIPSDAVVAASDFVLIHGNGVEDPARIAAMVDEVRDLPSYRPMPILFNEDDHFKFDEPMNNFMAALSRGASWGFFDPGESNYRDGYQCPPVNWGLNTARKRAFFELAREVAGV